MKKGVVDKKLTSDELLLAIEVLVESLAKKHDISLDNFIELLNKRNEEKNIILIPCSLFRNRHLGILEIITKYLREEVNLSYKEIAILLNRDDRTIWSTYNSAIKKEKERFKITKDRFLIPISIFKERDFGFLELLTSYLKENHNLSYHEIAMLLNRDDRTIWTAYNRLLQKKNGNHKIIENESK